MQVLEGVEGQTMIARLSQKEPTLIRIDQGKIRRVDGTEGDFIMEKNDELGQVLIKPMADHPFSVFITDDRGRAYPILMTPVDVPADMVVLKDKTRKAAAPSVVEKAGSYERTIKGMVLIMASGAIPSDMDIREIGQDIPLWKEARLSLERTYIGQSIVGEKYTLANVSGAAMVVAEQELYRKGVLGISVENMNLAPGEATNVFVVREKKSNE